MSQLRFPSIDPPEQVRADASRRSPAFWVRRLKVLQELKSGDEYVIRDIELRRGLNIIWAPPHAAPDGNALFQNGVYGHTAGKTTLCRFIRHILGERGFAADPTKRRIREKFPHGWVLGEVFVSDLPWIVGRPFGIGPRPFCIRGGSFDHVFDGTERSDYREFLDAITAITVDALPASRYPTSDEAVQWENILPWLTRDQECRFAEFLEWRHTSSDSETPSLSVDERQFIVRSVLNLISDQERAELEHNAQLVRNKRIATQREPLAAHQAGVEHNRVTRMLGVELPPASEPLFALQARSELTRRTTALEQRLERLNAEDRRTELHSTLEQAIANETNAKRTVCESKGRLDFQQETLNSLTGNNLSNLFADLPPARNFCNVRMEIARERNCPFAEGRPIDFAAQKAQLSAEEELKEQRNCVSGLESELEQARRVLANAEAATIAARKAWMSAMTRFDEEKGMILGEQAQNAHIARSINEAETAWREAAELADSVKNFSTEIAQSYLRQEQLRQESREAISRFSARFDYIVRALLGGDVTGRVDTSGRSITLTVEQQGERESAAIATIKLLAFDMATLTCSLEGQGVFPRFLIHDGPREADLATDVYERLFLLAHELEKCFSGEPSFQYIVATTTPPPALFQAEPWLRARLAGVPTEDRLLRCDL